MDLSINKILNERAGNLACGKESFTGAIYANNAVISDTVSNAVILTPNTKADINGIYTPNIILNDIDITERLSIPVYYANITTVGATLTVNEEHNYLDFDVTWNYSAEGVFTLTCSDDEFQYYTPYFSIVNGYAGASFVKATKTGNDTLTFNVYDIGEDLRDVIEDCSIEIKFLTTPIITTDVTVYDNSNIILSAYFAGLNVSFNGIRWEEVSIDNDQIWEDVIRIPELSTYLACGGSYSIDKQFMTSTDGVGWTAQSGVVSNTSLYGVAYSDTLDLAVAVGYDNTDTGVILTSSDLITWSAPSSPDSVWKDVAWGASAFVAVSLESAVSNIAISTDGSTWTSLTASGLSRANGIHYSTEASMFVAVDDTTIFKSVTGVTWSAGSTAYEPTGGIAYSPELDLWAITTTDNILTSSDLSTFTASSIQDSSWYRVIWSSLSRKFIAINSVDNNIAYSENGTVWTSVEVSSGGQINALCSI